MSHLVRALALAGLLILEGCGSSSDSANESVDLTERSPAEDEIIRIPVVVHVIYHDEETNISPEKIESQLQVINEDFRKLNADYTKTPDEFINLVADVGIEFYLATEDPEGLPTSGVTRTYSEHVDGWSGRSLDDETAIEDLPLYFSSMGGQDAWPSDTYLNVWVASMVDRLGRVGLSGYSSTPGDDPRIDGVVIEPRVFGLFDPLEPRHTKGRTLTHEVGHWLSLLHIFAADGSCDSSDEVEDTPTAEVQYKGYPVYPQVSCGTTDITMNFMDYVADDAMYMFTNGQRERMRSVFNVNGPRHALYLNSLKQSKE